MEKETLSNYSVVDSAGEILSESSDLAMYCPYTPSPNQAMFLELACRDAMYGGRAGVGKSAVLIWGALQGVAVPEYSAILLRRTFTDLMLSGALLDRMRTWFDKSPAKWCHDEKWFLFPSGAKIAVGYAETDKDIHRYKSAEFQYVGMDEGSEFTPYQLQFMFSRLRRTVSFPKHIPVRYRIGTNPGGPSHEFLMKRYGIKEEDRFPPGSPMVVTRSHSGEPRVFFPAHPEDNPGLDWDDYNKSLDELGPIQQMQFKNGIWVQDTAGLCYPSISKVGRIPGLPKGYDWSFGLALDIGASNNCAVAIYAVSEHYPSVVLAKTFEPEDTNNSTDLGKLLVSLDKELHFEWMIADQGALGKGYINDFRKYRKLPVMPVDKNDKPGYMRLFDDAMASGEVVLISGECDTFEEQAKNLLWKDSSKLKEMPGARNHSCDAALYGWRRCGHYTTTPRPKDEPRLDDLERKLLERINSNSESPFGGSIPKGLYYGH